MKELENSALRATPFPKVTELICRLPLLTLFNQLEAINLEDLMRISVRPGVWINLALGFSRAVKSAPDIQKHECFTNWYTSSPNKSIPR